jgi:hypothetical protein
MLPSPRSRNDVQDDAPFTVGVMLEADRGDGCE